MSIKNNQSIDGIHINKLKDSSKEQVVRVCDKCLAEKIVQYRTIRLSQNKHNTKEILCHSCLLKYYKKPVSDITKQKMSQAGLIRFQDDGNKEYLRKRTKYNHPRYKDNRRIIHKGYLARYEGGKTIFMHREIYECHYDRVLKSGEHVHHINCDSMDNRPENLVVTDNKSDHRLTHSSLEKTAALLVKKGIILFNRDTKSYFINPNLDNRFMEISLGFTDVAMKQKKNICRSRLDINTDTEIIHGVIRPIGLIASNMSTVTNAEFCIALYKLGAFGIMHRAATDDHIIETVKKIARECEWTAGSIGVNNQQFLLAKKLIHAGCNIITIDIAHGFSERVADLAKRIKKFNKNTKIIIGNLTNPEAITLFYRDIDAIKVGIASGLVCETKNSAGCFERQFSAVLKFKQIAKDFNIPVISDGGIREPSDFVKAIGAGANSVMAGSIFARCPESAAEEVDGKKIYAGMASRYVQNQWKGALKPGTCPEGRVLKLSIGEPVAALLERYQGALRSGITYGGGADIQSFQDIVEFVRLAK